MASEAAVDLSSLSRLSEQVSGKAEAVREKGRQMLEHRAEYARVKGRLEGLSDNMTHKVMVPMTSKAFMPGTLVHTNEVMVLLGDNCSSRPAPRRRRRLQTGESRSVTTSWRTWRRSSTWWRDGRSRPRP